MQFFLFYILLEFSFIRKEKASLVFKTVSGDLNDDDDGDDDDDDVSIQNITNTIKEIKKMAKRKTEYSTINTENLFDECSSTLITFLSKLSSNFDKSLNVALIRAIVISALKNSFVQLQIALGILVHDKKSIENLHKRGIISTYQEARKYKVLAAVER